jgi:DNA-binding winged helix-turn-helix (wHTH) protein
VPPSQWFCALLDTASDVYFRYTLAPRRRGFAYISPAVAVLTGHPPAAFVDDAGLIKRLIAPADRRLLRRMLHARRGLTTRVHLVRDGAVLPVDVRTVALVRARRVVAIEGVARLATESSARDSAHRSARGAGHDAEPAQQRLAALMYEVHDLLHRMLPPSADRARTPRTLTLGALVLDPDRLIVTDSGTAVSLTSREVLVLRYLLERRGRVITRRQLLTDVWSYTYTGDDRTVDVHISRLRRKLPSLRARLVAIRHVGYRLDDDEEMPARVANS